MAYTETDWKNTLEYIEGFQDISDPRMIEMEWDDLTETPREAVIRLNREVMEYAEKAAAWKERALEAEAKLNSVRDALEGS